MDRRFGYSMASLYLYFNALMYGLLAIWCVAATRMTAKSLGYLQFSAEGQSEFRVIYGGLQFGLAIAFAYLAASSERWELGILFALAVYVPIVIARLTTIAIYWPVSNVTLAIAASEVVLLVAALLLYVQAQT